MDHGLAQKDIAKILKKEYYMEVDHITNIKILDETRKPMMQRQEN